ncbi:NAD(P)/FAD-dependent oxidoreductase [Thioalkalivibrio sp. HK1]|uniref:NAD(P)/FAD-dependent oxidoreductase n=1 Tax=Thioalkalivibrio sp. HK1 TaxID=1469245 RepID=UPI0004708939|nr:FAD-dependent oxidoreductase [Thioalkalivibrio sp. HK1]
MNDSPPEKVVVIGAGIVGVCCALELQERGVSTVLIDRQEPGAEGAASFGNAGMLSSASLVPLPAPGMLKKVPGWLLNRDGPLAIRWSYLPTLLPWLIRFLRAGNDRRQRSGTAALAALHARTLELHARLARRAGVPDLTVPVEHLQVYRSKRSIDEGFKEWDLRRAHGIDFERIDRRTLAEMEPDLSSHYTQAMLIRDQGRTTDPGRLVQALARRFVDIGGRFVHAEVRAIQGDSGRIRSVSVGDGDRCIEGEGFVLSAGIFSKRIGLSIGLSIPLDSENGYHITCPEPKVRISHTVMDGEYKLVANPMDPGLRFAGMAEFSGADSPDNPRRIEVIARLAKRMYPNLSLEGFRSWRGRRPSTPDGLPVIGPSPSHENLWLAFGHGHTGMIAGPMTGQIIASMITGSALDIDVFPFQAERFHNG